MADFQILSEVNAQEFAGFRDAIWQSLEHFGAEFLVGLAALVIFIVDLFLSPRSSKHLAWLAVVACIIPAFEPLHRLSLFFSTDLDPYPADGLFLGMVSLDSFSDFYKVFFLLGAIPVIVLSYLSRQLQDRPMGEYYGILLAAVLGSMLMASSTHFLMIFMSLELLSICSYVLVGFLRRDRRSVEASLKYIIYGSVAAAVMAYGMSLYYGMTGSADLAEMARVLRPEALGEGGGEGGDGALPNRLAVTTIVSLLLIFAGMAYKISSIPMHFWAPDAYEGAPTPVTAFLSVLSKAAGFALALRFFHSLTDTVNGLALSDPSRSVWQVVGLPDTAVGTGGQMLTSPWITLLIVVSILTMTLGNLAALWQTNLKRFMAYSSIAHAGYMMMGLTILNQAEGGSEVGGVGAVSFYLLAYLAMNFGAFTVIILVENRLGSVDIKDYRGLGRRAPFLAISLMIFLFSLIGIPPTAGFTGKWQLFMGILDMGRIEYYILAAAAAINTAISAYYYMKIGREMYLADSDEASPVTSSLLGKALVAVVLFMTFYLFFEADWILDIVRELQLRV